MVRTQSSDFTDSLRSVDLDVQIMNQTSGRTKSKFFKKIANQLLHSARNHLKIIANTRIILLIKELISLNVSKSQNLALFVQNSSSIPQIFTPLNPTSHLEISHKLLTKVIENQCPSTISL